MKSFDEIFSAFGGPAELGRALGVRTEHTASMRQRGAIPPMHWPRLIAAAEERGIDGITPQTLLKLYAERRSPPPAQPSEAVA